MLNKDNLKSRLITASEYPPKKTQGVSGSIHISFHNNKPTLYAKYKGSWYKTALESLNAPNKPNSDSIWNTWEFTTFRAAANNYCFRDVDDIDDYRRWDATNSLITSKLTLTTAQIAGQFTVPEDCRVHSMYGQITGDAATSCPTVTLWTFTPADATNGNMNNMGSAQPNSGSALTADKNYTFSKTTGWVNRNLKAGDIIVPTIHYTSGTNQSYYGHISVKFVSK